MRRWNFNTRIRDIVTAAALKGGVNGCTDMLSGWRLFWGDSRGTGTRQMAAFRYLLRTQLIFWRAAIPRSERDRTRIRGVSIFSHYGLLEAALYCTKPTLGTGVGSGTSRMGPNCASYRLIFSPSALKMRLACAGLTITLDTSLPCGTLGNT